MFKLEEPAKTWEKAYRLTSRVLLESGIAAPIHPGIASQLPMSSEDSRELRRIDVDIAGTVTILELDENKLKSYQGHVIVAAVLAMVCGEHRKTILQRARLSLLYCN